MAGLEVLRRGDVIEMKNVIYEECREGDILLIANENAVSRPVVLVEKGVEYYFVANIESYVMVEGCGNFVYGISDSGCEKIKETTKFTKIGHIELTPSGQERIDDVDGWYE